jgi:hypothetical protein
LPACNAGAILRVVTTTTLGGCLCGRVRYAIAGPALESTHCHCSRCRRQHGAAFATYVSFDREHVDITGSDALTRYQSTDEVARSFCTTCGSSLLWEHAGLPDVVWIALGTIDDASAIEVDAHIWSASAVTWGATADDLPRHPEAFPIPALLELMERRRTGERSR